MFENPWAILGVAPDVSEADLRRAYTAQLKLSRPEDDPVAFQRLRDAYESALETIRDPLGVTPQIPEFRVDAEAAPAPTPASVPALEPADDMQAAADALAVEILDACSPFNFDPAQLTQLVANHPALIAIGMRQATGLAIARRIALGASVSPHAIVDLAQHFGWNDVAVTRSDPVFDDPRFAERMQFAKQRSRPSTRQHSTPVVPAIGIGVALLIGLSNVLSKYQVKIHFNPAAIHSNAEMLLGGAVLLCAAVLVGVEVWVYQSDETQKILKLRRIARIVLGGIMALGVLYFVGRP